MTCARHSWNEIFEMTTTIQIGAGAMAIGLFLLATLSIIVGGVTDALMHDCPTLEDKWVVHEELGAEQYRCKVTDGDNEVYCCRSVNGMSPDARRLLSNKRLIALAGIMVFLDACAVEKP